MIIRIDTEKCNGCGACAEICPVGAIAVTGKALLDKSRCVSCRMCLTCCPVKAISTR